MILDDQKVYDVARELVTILPPSCGFVLVVVENKDDAKRGTLKHVTNIDPLSHAHDALLIAASHIGSSVGCVAGGKN